MFLHINMGMCFCLLYLIKIFKMAAELYKGVLAYFCCLAPMQHFVPDQFRFRSLPVPIISGSVHFLLRSLPVPIMSGFDHFRFRSLPVPIISGYDHCRFRLFPVTITSGSDHFRSRVPITSGYDHFRLRSLSAPIISGSDHCSSAPRDFRPACLPVHMTSGPHDCYSSYSRLLHCWNDNEAVPANSGFLRIGKVKVAYLVLVLNSLALYSIWNIVVC